MQADSTMLHTIHVSIGANVGDPGRVVVEALGVLREHDAFTDFAASSLYRTRPVGGVQQPDFVNGVFRARVALEPHEVLDALQAVEARFGRVRDLRWGPRTLDLDLLSYDDRILDDARLTLPHPELTRRGFVLVPLAELDPGWRHPLSGARADALLAAWRDAELDARGAVVKMNGNGETA
jgi:2-amino-4-hydroxy-6-hydroxymethyldihydropteridine diphosphokinase